MESTKTLTRKQTKTLSSQCTHPSSASRSPFVFSFLDFRNALVNIASCANVSEDESGFRYSVDITYTNYDENENTTPETQEQPDSQEPLSPSSKKLSAVTVMIYDEFGQLQDSPQGTEDYSNKLPPVTSSSTSTSTSPSKQCGQEGKENHSNDDQDSSSTASSCRLVERLRREKRRQKTVALMSMSDFSGISPTSATKQHKDRIHRKNYNSTKVKKRKKQSWFRRNLNSKEEEEKSDGSVSTQGTRSTSGSGSVTKAPSQDSISTMSSSSRTRDSSKKTNKKKNSGPVSILRTSSNYTRNNAKASSSVSSSELSASTIRFEEGTVFQDPNQKNRRKVRRVRKSERKGHRQRYETNKNSQAQSDPTGIEIVGLSRKEATFKLLGSDRCYKDDDNCKLAQDLTPYVFR